MGTEVHVGFCLDISGITGYILWAGFIYDDGV